MKKSTWSPETRAFLRGAGSVLDLGGTLYRGYKQPTRHVARSRTFATRWAKMGVRLQTMANTLEVVSTDRTQLPR